MLNTNLNIKIKQNVLITQQLVQAFSVLQMPINELREWLINEIQCNPLVDNDSLYEKEDPSTDQFGVFEYLDENFYYGLYPEEPEQKKLDIDQYLPFELSLFEHLMRQAHQCFDQPRELVIAEQIIGNLDQRGFVSDNLDPLHLPILKKIQSFDPIGIAARDLRESLLIQLQFEEKQNTLAYRIITDFFDSFLHKRFSLIKKALDCSSEDLTKTIKCDIRHLNFFPSAAFDDYATHYLLPDLTLKTIDGKWYVEIAKTGLPEIQISTHYDKLLNEQSLKKYIHDAQWLKKIVAQRDQNLKKIGEILLKSQYSFLEGTTSSLSPLKIEDVAEKLDLHPSTISRTIMNKYIAIPQGLYPLNEFFSRSPLANAQNAISKLTIKETISKLIKEEDKNQPLSDQEIKNKLNDYGIPCTRRTVTKYRLGMNYLSSSERKLL